MFIHQFYTKCLSEASYYVESNGEAAIIDPIRDTNAYLELAEERGAKIKYVFETHFHADFVSGHIELARQTGANIVYGPTAQANYDIVVAEDEEIYQIGDIQLKVLHTPGHTMESSCFLLIDEQGKEQAVFTGDTLFIGDVGRPDLAVKTDLSREDLARYLYRSINEKLLVLDDDIIVYPGHGAGSQCGKALSNETESTIGKQKELNYALQASSEEDFVAKVTEGLTTPPQYFPKNAAINKTGYTTGIEDIMKQSLKPLSVGEFKMMWDEYNILVLDTRTPEDFSMGHIPGALNIGLNGSFAVWVGTLIKELNTPILLVTEPGKEEESVLRLARVGYENVSGYLKGGMNAWKEADQVESFFSNVCPVDFRMNPEGKTILDVRTPQEYEEGHFEGALNFPLASLQDLSSKLSRSDQYYVYCKSGYRSVVACSILESLGFEHIFNVKKGYQGIVDPKSTCCCSKTDSNS